jgi:hypothetical protein
MENTLLEHIFAQMVNFPTWSRFVNNYEQISTTDYIYCPNPFIIENICSLKPIFGEHLLLIIDIEANTYKERSTFRSSWMNYIVNKHHVMNSSLLTGTSQTIKYKNTGIHWKTNY